MAEQILQEKKATSRIVDALGIAGVSIASSMLMNKIVGNNNFISGGSKMGVGLLSSGFGKGKATELIGAGFLVDGATDIMNALFGGTLSNLSGKMGVESSSQSTGAVFI